MTQASGYRGRLAPLLLSVLGLMVAQVASAKSGGVDYSWGAGALAKAHDYTVTMMLYVLYVCYAVGSVMAIISALLIYFKMQYHRGLDRLPRLLRLQDIRKTSAWNRNDRCTCRDGCRAMGRLPRER